jgi:hypothetical protein
MKSAPADKTNARMVVTVTATDMIVMKDLRIALPPQLAGLDVRPARLA